MKQINYSVLFFSLSLIVQSVMGRYYEEKNWKDRNVRPKYDTRFLENQDLHTEDDLNDDIKFHCGPCSSSSSSSSDSDDCKCDKIIPITKVPYTIKKSGKYCLAKDVEYCGKNAAITIKANDVTLNLSNHSIVLTQPATAILILGAEVTIKDDGLHYKPNHRGPGIAIGVHIKNTSKVNIADVAAGGFDNGVLIENSEDVQLHNCRFVGCPFSGISSINSRAVLLQHITLKDNGYGLIFDEGCKDCFIDQIYETNSVTGTFIRWIDGITIQNSFFEITSANDAFSCMQVGSELESQGRVNDILISNCHFINRQIITQSSPAAGFDGLAFVAGSNAVVQNCVIDINASARNANPTLGLFFYQNGALHISGTIPESNSFEPLSDRIFTNLRVTNCVITNSGSNGIVTENFTHNVTIENSTISGRVGALLQGTSAFVFKNNEIQHCGITGISIGESGLLLPILGSTSNAILNNVIANNSQIGVSLSDRSKFNLVTNNQIFSNAVHNVFDQGSNNQIFNNVVYNPF